jgi:hypothetical protein
MGLDNCVFDQIPKFARNDQVAVAEVGEGLAELVGAHEVRGAMQHPRQAANVLSKGPRDGAIELVTEYLEPGMMLNPGRAG